MPSIWAGAGEWQNGKSRRLWPRLVFDVSQRRSDGGPAMKQNYLIAPLIGMAVFVGYYFYWKSQPQQPRQTESRVVDGYASRDGKKEAEGLLADDKLAFIESGPAVSWDAERREIAASKYGVELRRIDGVATEGFARYVDSFNRVMRLQILARHGRGFFDALHKEAIALHEVRSAKKG